MGAGRNKLEEDIIVLANATCYPEMIRVLKKEIACTVLYNNSCTSEDDIGILLFA